jgi:oligopeptide/dipeptide ABC transporter ATP-binding protein
VEIKDLVVAYYQNGVETPVVRNVSFSIKKNETLGLVGESGSGKSVTSKAIMRLIAEPPGKIAGGKIIFEDRDILQMKEKELQKMRGKEIAMIFQEPMTSLNPLYTCGNQIAESILLHSKCTKKEAWNKAVEILKLVGVPSPEKRVNAYPHELSGGMRQRVMIAIALSCNPRLLIADEPTTALDPTIQSQILKLIHDMQDEREMSVLLITHDMGIVAENCDRVAVMYAGQIVEIADVKTIFAEPEHPYTIGLLKAIPKLDEKVERLYNIRGMVPRFNELPEGCTFAPRCDYCEERCRKEKPELKQVKDEHYVRCHLAGSLHEGGFK